MDYEVLFWVVAAVVAYVVFVAWGICSEPQDKHHTFGFWEKNVDDMEDRWD